MHRPCGLHQSVLFTCSFRSVLEALDGAVWILFMRADGTVKSEQKISNTAGGFTGVIDDEGRFGGAMASLGDLDGEAMCWCRSGFGAVGTLAL